MAVAQFGILYGLTFFKVGTVALVRNVYYLFAHFEVFANLLAVFERVQIVDIKDEEYGLRPVYELLILFVDVVITVRKLFIYLVLAEEVPHFIFVYVHSSDDALRENVAVPARSLLNLDGFALIEIHVPQE